MPQSTDLIGLSAQELLAAYAARTLSPVEVTEAALAQVERCEPVLKATYMLDPDGARRMAQASEARWRAGTPLATRGVTLDGVPCTIKENVATKGVPVPLGTAATELVPAPADAPPAARMREAGAVILGKTTMPEYGAMSSGLSSFHSLTRNPWNTAMNPGGSSAGAGAAGAACYAPLHIGTDIGGSVRFPAAWNGLVGLKPSLGRIPIDPPYMGRAAGPMTRSVADAALMMAVLSRPDPEGRDSMNLPPADLAWDDPNLSLAGLRIGLQLDPGCGLPVDPQVIEPVRAAARAFEAAGAIVEPLDPWMDDEMLHALDRFWRIRALRDIEALTPERREKVLPIFLEWVAPARELTALQGFEAYSATMAIRTRTVAATHPFDFVLSPVAANTSFPADWAYPSNDVARAHDQIGFTVPYNMSEQPAVSVCCGYDSNGVPMGLQIAGRRFDDVGVLRMAASWEAMWDGRRPWPTSPM
ncbi:aspartyl-tRNA(Asn)/glutamyl-tRNA(Gln) amidotransferase subunit A [Palleronia aestuarii]|uniref:Aspartyl-tRNA(Asn)/glutamyl-tRNA(Gln) amidotransferase subunit A n=1 Tax=Palleronia aestuarii TaxID=568105 RepID=A0A2W7NAR5_9RHOB|nr:amidase [Palleronia aestuarii]PZX17090.1 aspartyl-tRNA(Asn)/glutamyl-tRNA(Gln) amidotransferase subunit A [Palleronia aestuarii]